MKVKKIFKEQTLQDLYGRMRETRFKKEYDNWEEYIEEEYPNYAEEKK